VRILRFCEKESNRERDRAVARVFMKDTTEAHINKYLLTYSMRFDWIQHGGGPNNGAGSNSGTSALGRWDYLHILNKTRR
jgi:hypothetical protein